MNRTVSTFLLGAVIACTASELQGESPVLAEVYGRGVHLYFAGQYPEALEALSSAIDNGTEDPRPFYFRGLVNAVCGDAGSAEADWRMGAQKELVSANAGLVGPSLKRIQGPIRIQLEKIRQLVRLEERNNTQARNVDRAEEMRQVESKILRDRGAAPQGANPFQRDGSITGEGAPRVDAQDPFKDDPTAPSLTPSTESPAEPMPFDANPTLGNDPFAPAAPAMDAPAAADPFAPAAADPFAPAPATEPPADANNPFGANPFGN